MIVLTEPMKAKPKADFRDAVFGAIEDVMRRDENAIILTNDMGAVGLDKISQFAPTRVINVGITEQNMMSVAGGLALNGRTVFVYGIISHMIFRALEQIKLDICVQNLPVIIVGVGAGLAYGVDGPTHHGLEDVAVMRVLPNMSVYNPSDCASAAQAIHQAYKSHTPCFVRMDKEGLPNLYDEGQNLDDGFIAHGAGEGIIISSGVVTWAALQAQEILQTKNIQCKVIDLIRIKPLATDELRTQCKNAKWVVVVDEATANGGLGELAANALIGMPLELFTSVNLGHKFLLGSAKREWAWQNFGLSGTDIAKLIMGKIGSKV